LHVEELRQNSARITYRSGENLPPIPLKRRKVAGLSRNTWQLYSRTGGRFIAERVAGFIRYSHQHLGIVAGVCSEIGIAEKIDEFVQRPKRKDSVGKAIEAMILNALGFTGRALYLTPQFYKGRPTEILLGDNVKAEDRL